ncbi:MAG TPA: MerR family transcriptional regulator [Nitriliruptorales bacterium]|nr:MerR family transcriptional regulator [Nitriliruptorales bacterium]
MTDQPGRSRDDGVYVISIAAELAGMHPQTLRAYERSGLVSPRRSSGNVRRYSDADVERLQQIQELTGRGLNLVGVRMVLDLREQVAQARQRIAQLETQLDSLRQRLRDEVAAAHRSHRYELVPLGDSAIELYHRRHGGG